MSREPKSAPYLVWRNAGEPAHKYVEEPYSGPCATCAAPCKVGVSTSQINNPTFSNHAGFFKFGTHVCRACAWLYGVGKGRPGNVIAYGDTFLRPMISADSATQERPTWSEVVFGEVVNEPFGTTVTGVLTTDTKPRLWPRMRITETPTVGLYVHAPDYAVSEYRDLDLPTLAECGTRIDCALELGFTKRRIYDGLLSDYLRAKKNMEGAMLLENELREARSWPEFVPAMIVSHKRRELLEDHGNNGDVETAGATGGEVAQDHDRLF